MRHGTLRTVGFAAILLASTGAEAATIQAGPNDDVEAMINALAPGDELVLADGMYPMSGRFGVDVSGTAAQPILIRAADGATPHFHRPDAAQNIWDITASYLTIRGLTFSGGSAGLRVEAANNFTIEDCEVFETADVAVRFNDGGQVYDSITIQRNHIHDTHGTGEGMYLGCNDNGCQMSNSLIANNYVHHTNAGDVSQGDGIELKEGSFGNVIRDNVIHDTNYPCILTYSTVGNGAPNLIEGNLLWNCADNAIQSAADATIRNNIILGAGNTGIAMQPHQAGAPSNLVVVHNTVLNAGTTIAVRQAVGTVVLANNAVYSQNGSAIQVVGTTNGITVVGNVGEGGLNGPAGGFTAGALGTDFVNASYAMAPSDVFPAFGGALEGAGDVAHVTAVDFNGTARGGVPDVGAYASAVTNPGWTLAAGFKGESSMTPPGDMGPGTPDMGGNMQSDMSAPPVGDVGSNPPGNDMSSGPTGQNNPPGPDAGGDSGSGGGSQSGEPGGCGCATGDPGSTMLAWGVIAWWGRRRGRRRPRA